MFIDKGMKSLKTILDKNAAKDYESSDKAEDLSKIAFCLRYWQRFSAALIEFLDKSLSV